MKQRQYQAQRLPSESLSENDDIQDSAMFVVGPAGGTQTMPSSSTSVRSTTPATTATTATALDDMSSSEELEDDDIRDSAHPFTKLVAPEEVENEAFAALAVTSGDRGQSMDEDSDIGDSARTGEVVGSLIEIGEGSQSTSSVPNCNLGPSSAEASAGSTRLKYYQEQDSNISTNQTASMVAIPGSPADSAHGNEDDGGDFDEWSSGNEEDSSSYEDEEEEGGDDDSSSYSDEIDSDDSGEEFYEVDEEDSSIEESSGSEYDDESDGSADNEKEVSSQHLDDSHHDQYNVYEDDDGNIDDEVNVVEDTAHGTFAGGSSYSQSQLDSSTLMSIDTQETPRASNKSPRSNDRYQINRPRRRQSDETQDQSLFQSSGEDDDRVSRAVGNPIQGKQQKPPQQQQQSAENVGYLTPPSGSNLLTSIGAKDLLPVAFDDDDDQEAGILSSDDGEEEMFNNSASSIDSDLLQLINEGKLEDSSRLLEGQIEKKEQEKKQLRLQKEQTNFSGEMEYHDEEQPQSYQQKRQPRGVHPLGAVRPAGSRGDENLSDTQPGDESFASIDSDLFDVMKDTELDGSSTLLDVQIQRQKEAAAFMATEQKSSVSSNDNKIGDSVAQQKAPEAPNDVKEAYVKQSEEPTTNEQKEELESFIGDDKEDTVKSIHSPILNDAEEQFVVSQSTSEAGGDEHDVASRAPRRQEGGNMNVQQKYPVVPKEKTEASPSTDIVTKTVETLADAADSAHSIDLSTAMEQHGDIPELSPKQQGEKQVLEILLDKEPVEEPVEQGHDSDNIMLGVWSFCAGDDENIYDPEEPPDLKTTAKVPSTTATDAPAMAMKVSSNHSERTEITSNMSPGSNQKKNKKLRPSSPAKKVKKVKKKKKKLPELTVTTEAKPSSTTATANVGGQDVTTSHTGEPKKRRTKKKVDKIVAAVSGVDPATSTRATEAADDVIPAKPKRKSGKKLGKKVPKMEGDDSNTNEAIKGTKKKKRKKKDGVAKKRGKRSDYEPKDGDEAQVERTSNTVLGPAESARQNESTIIAETQTAEGPTQPLLAAQSSQSPKQAGVLSGFLSTNSKPSGHIRKSSDNSSVVEMLSPLLPVKKSVSSALWDMGDVHSTPKKVIKGLLDMFPERAANAVSLNLSTGESPPSPPRPGMLKRAASVPNFNRVDSGSEALSPNTLDFSQLGTPPQSAPSKVKGTSRTGNTSSPSLTISTSFSLPGNDIDSRMSGLIPEPPLLSPGGKSRKDPKPSNKKVKSSRSNKKKGTSKSVQASPKDSPRRKTMKVTSK